VYKTEGRLKEAEGLYMEAIEIQKKKYGLDYVGLALPYNNLALVYKTEGRLKEAEGLIKEAIKIEKKKYGLDYVGLA